MYGINITGLSRVYNYLISLGLLLMGLMMLGVMAGADPRIAFFTVALSVLVVFIFVYPGGGVVACFEQYCRILLNV